MGFFKDLIDRVTGKAEKEALEKWRRAEEEKRKRLEPIVKDLLEKRNNDMARRSNSSAHTPSSSSVNSAEKEIYKVSVDKAYDFSEGFGLVKSNKFFYFISADGKKMYGPYDDASSYSEGLAMVIVNGTAYYINYEGKAVLGPYINYNGTSALISERCNKFKNGYAMVKTRDSIYNYNYSIIDKNGNIIIDYLGNGECVTGFTDGFFILAFEDGYYYVNGKGEKVFGPYSKAYSFSEGFAIVEQNGEQWYIDEKGTKKFGPYSHCRLFHEGVAFVMEDEETGGFIDKTGEYIYGPESSDFFPSWAYDVSYQGFIRAVSWGKGSVLLNLDMGIEYGPFVSTTRYVNGYSIIECQDGKTYALDLQGVKHDCIGDNSFITLLNNQGFQDGWLAVFSEKDDCYHYVNIKGEYLNINHRLNEILHSKTKKVEIPKWEDSLELSAQEKEKRAESFPWSRYPMGFYIRIDGYTLLIPLWHLKKFLEKGKDDYLEFIKDIMKEEKEWHYWTIWDDNENEIAYFNVDKDRRQEITQSACFFVPSRLINYTGHPYVYDTSIPDSRRPLDNFEWSRSHIEYDAFLSTWFLRFGLMQQKFSAESCKGIGLSAEEVYEKIKDSNVMECDINIDDIVFLNKEKKGQLGDFEKHFIGLPIEKKVIQTTSEYKEHHIVGVRFDNQYSGCYYYFGNNNMYNIGDKVLVPTSNNGTQKATIVYKKIYKNNEVPPYPYKLMKEIISKE